MALLEPSAELLTMSSSEQLAQPQVQLASFTESCKYMLGESMRLAEVVANSAFQVSRFRALAASLEAFLLSGDADPDWTSTIRDRNRIKPERANEVIPNSSGLINASASGCRTTKGTAASAFKLRIRLQQSTTSSGPLLENEARLEECRQTASVDEGVASGATDSHPKSLFQCPICDARLSRKDVLERHVKLMHSPGKTPKQPKSDFRACPICSELRHKRSLKRHILLSHQPPSKAEQSSEALDTGVLPSSICNAQLSSRDPSERRIKLKRSNDRAGKPMSQLKRSGFHARMKGQPPVKRRARIPMSTTANLMQKQNTFIPCPVCSKLRHKRSLKRHLVLMHSPRNNEKTIGPQANSKSKLSADGVGMPVSPLKSQIRVRVKGQPSVKRTPRIPEGCVAANLQQQEGSYIPCPVCSKLRHVRSLKRHLQLKHSPRNDGKTAEPKPDVFPCSICNRKLSRPDVLRRHMQLRHSQEGPLYCARCGFKTKMQSILTRHLSDGCEMFQCTTCGVVKNSRPSLRSHMRKHEEASLLCEICSARLKCLTMFKKHMLSHAEVKQTYACERCEYKTWCSWNLKAHMDSHAERIFRCDKDGCTKAYPTKIYLDKHTKRCHATTQPFACDQCEWRFALAGDLRRHMVRHSNEKPFVCFVCKRAFPRKGRMRMHIRRVHKRSPDEPHDDIEASGTVPAQTSSRRQPAEHASNHESRQIPLAMDIASFSANHTAPLPANQIEPGSLSGQSSHDPEHGDAVSFYNPASFDQLPVEYQYTPYLNNAWS